MAEHANGIKGDFGHIRNALLGHMAGKPGGGRTSGWPETGKAFGNDLRRLMPAMAKIGIAITIPSRWGKGTYCHIRHTATRDAS